MSKDKAKGYQFNIVNGTVTAVYEVKNGHAKLEKIERDESWSVNGSSIIKSETEHGHTETTIFSDPDGDGIYTKLSKSISTDAVLTVSSSVPMSGRVKDDSLELHFGNRYEGKPLYQNDDAHETHISEIELVGVSSAELVQM